MQQHKAPKQTLQTILITGIQKSIAPLFLVLCMLSIAFWIYGEASTNYSWQWGRIWRYVGVFTDIGFKPGILLSGVYVTLKIAFWSLWLAFFMGLWLAFMNLSRSPVLSLFAKSIISIIRNTPLLIQLFIFYFVISNHLHLSPFHTAIICLALFEGVYVAEIIRSGIISISHTQWEASFSLGMNTSQTLFYVIMPQVFRNILPSLAGQLISLIKDTSLVSAIAVADLTLQARNVISDTFLSFETWILVACIYFILTLFISIPTYYIKRLLTH